ATRGAPGRSILIHSAAGGLGSAAVDLARLAGMTTIGVVSSDAKAQALAEHGAHHVINAAPHDIAARVQSITNGVGVDLILDAVGGKAFAENLKLLARFGLAVCYGRLQGGLTAELIAALEHGPGYLNSGAVRVFTMHTLDDRPELRAKSMHDLIGWLAA